MSLRWHTTRGVNHFYNYHNTTKTHDTKPAMSGRKLPPSQLTLTQLSSHDKKRRSTDNALLSLDENTCRCKIVTSRVVSSVRRESTALFGRLGTDDEDFIDILSPSDDSDEDKLKKSPQSPCLLPVAKFIPSPHEKYHEKSPPCASTIASKNANEELAEKRTGDKVEGKYLEGVYKTLIKN